MSEFQAPPNTLIPHAGDWMDHNFNVMLIGLHGVGKTQIVLDETRKKGLKLKYYSCSTLDPFTDLVGVPFARTKVNDDGSETEYLKMVRQVDLDEAEIIFMDEFNRADSKVHNALMEIIQFKSLNGEKLPNLRMVWAAMNPPNQEYDVEELDPALIDRFDIFEDVPAKPSAAYLTYKGIREPIAQALIAWHADQNNKKRNKRELITPRRLEKIGHIYELTGTIKNSYPLWFKVDHTKLKEMLADAERRAESVGLTGSAQSGPSRRFQYTDTWIEANEVEVSEYLRENPGDLETHKAVKSVIEKRQGTTIARDFAPVADALVPSVLEAMIAGMAIGKLTKLHEGLSSLPQDIQTRAMKLTEVVTQEVDNRTK